MESSHDSVVPQLSAFILTYNEEKNLEPCLRSLKECVDDIHVVDSGSVDRTIEIARRYGCDVVLHTFEGHSKQRNWALRNLAFRHRWVIALDADHRVTPELSAELRDRFRKPLVEIYGYFVKRRQIFRGTWIHHGAYYPKWQLKVFQHKRAFCDDEEFDYRFYVDGPVDRLQHDILEDNLNEADISFWVSKHNKFAKEAAAEEFKRRLGDIGWKIKPRLFGNPDERALWLRERWYGLPLYARPFLYFFYRYFLRLGFLDGKQGFIFHFLQAFWFRLLVDIHLDELLSGRSPSPIIHSLSKEL